MGAEDAKVNTLGIGQKASALASAMPIILSLIAALYFVSISVASLLTKSIYHYWNVCFLLCSTALAGWMILYAGLLRLGIQLQPHRVQVRALLLDLGLICARSIEKPFKIAPSTLHNG